MSILIRGMEMPKSCAFCRFAGAYCYAKGDEDAHSTLSCPLVPVPSHGRLIDADATIEDIRNEIIGHQMNGMKGTPFYIEDLRAMWQRLEDEELVPTIIPAD